jgi:hypothetical protein
MSVQKQIGNLELSDLGLTTKRTITFPDSNVFIGPSVPLGAVLAIFTHMTGAYNCTATTAADDNGFVQCNGQTIADATSPMNGQVVPNINDSAFLMGTTGTTSSTTASANTKDLSHTHSVTSNVTVSDHGAHTHSVTVGTANLPAHSHSIDHDHSSVSTSDVSQSHTHNIDPPNTASSDRSAFHTHTIGYLGNVASGSGFTAYIINPQGGMVSTGNDSPGHTHATDLGAVTSTSASNGHSHTVDLPNFTGSSGNGPGSGTAITSGGTNLSHVVTNNLVTSGLSLSSSFDVRPKYIACRYIMRIK